MRVLLLVNATLAEPAERAIAEGRSPRKDYLELRGVLGADIVDLGILDRWKWTWVARRVLGASIAQALLAWFMLARYDAVFADRETVGFAVAALCKLRRRRPRLTMIGHLLSPRGKRLVVRSLRLHTAIDCVIVHSSLQQSFARQRLCFLPGQVQLIPYQCDEQFWAPREVPVKKQICSAGLEYRDYATLIKAVEALDLDVVIAAASHWSKHGTTAGVDIPPNVHMGSFGYEALRDLYAESLFVVMPLYDVDNQAGITAILEAMAMGKAVIVSHTRGQTDVIRDRRERSRSDPARQTQPAWIRALGAADSIAGGQTGIYVMPGDVAELRRAIVFLMEHPEQAREMGANGRRVVEATMSLDQFTARLAAVIKGEQLWSNEPVGRAGEVETLGSTPV